MVNKRILSFIVYTLVICLLTACSPNTPVPPTATPVPPTATSVPPTTTSVPPTETPEPTRPPFFNPFIYDIPEMYQVDIKTVRYPTLKDPSQKLAMEIFYPPNRQVGKLLPAVIIPNAFPLNSKFFIENGDMVLQDYHSWGRLIAANGLIAVMYYTLYPDDLEAVVKHIQQNSAELGIDDNRLGLFSGSSNAILASSFAYQENREYLKFAVFYYGYIMTPENLMRQEYDALCVEYECFGAVLPDIKRLRSDLPVLIVRSGQDRDINNKPIDRFVQLAEEQAVPLTLIRFEEGSHAFEWADTSFGEVKTRGIEIVQQTIDFMKTNAFAQE